MNSATVPVSFLIQSLFLLSDQNWTTPWSKWFFSISWEILVWEMVSLCCGLRRDLSPSGDKEKLPRDQRRLCTICCKLRWLNPGPKPSDSPATTGAKLIHNPFCFSSVSDTRFLCVWNVLVSVFILVGSGCYVWGVAWLRRTYCEKMSRWSVSKLWTTLSFLRNVYNYYVVSENS